ncbi:MAG: lysostaphin resistance A-like protein [Bellilinea sp.]
MEAQAATEKNRRIQAVLVFYLLAFVFSWLGWIPQALHARGWFPFDSPLFSLLGGGGPTLAAVAALLIFRQRDQIRGLFAALFKTRASAVWFIFVFGFWFAVAALALAGMGIAGIPLPAISQFAWASLPPVFVSMLISNVWEEIGWRGFALPRLQEKLSDLAAALIMGALWSVWHAPLLLNPASPMASLPWFGEVVFSLSLTVIYIWLYRNTGASLFFVTVFHAMSNTAAFVLLELGVFVSSYPYVVGLTAFWAALILLRYGTKPFSRPAVARAGQ